MSETWKKLRKEMVKKYISKNVFLLKSLYNDCVYNQKIFEIEINKIKKAKKR